MPSMPSVERDLVVLWRAPVVVLRVFPKGSSCLSSLTGEGTGIAEENCRDNKTETSKSDGLRILGSGLVSFNSMKGGY